MNCEQLIEDNFFKVFLVIILKMMYVVLNANHDSESEQSGEEKVGVNC